MLDSFSNTVAVCLPQETEIDYSHAVASPFWDLFQLPFDMDSEAWHATLDVVARAGEFAVRDCRLRSASHHGTYTITFRCACATAVVRRTQWR